RRRQIHYVGKLMRSDEVNAAAIRAQLDTWKHGSREEARAQHRLENLRDLLLRDDDALTELLQRCEVPDVQQFRATIRAARKEAKHNEALPPGSEPQRKHYRALFQALKALNLDPRSEERRVGKECRADWLPEPQTQTRQIRSYATHRER